MESIIGKKYWPVDNSYAICFNDRNTSYQLGGNHYRVPKQPEETEIISEPYEVWVWNYGPPRPLTFVNVRCHRGFEHRVLFAEHGFNPREMQPIEFNYKSSYWL